MGSRSLFPGVAVPHAFFGTFFRVERKYYPPSGRQPHRSRRSRRVNPHPGQGACACGRTKGLFARGKQSARFALPCAPLVVCLNSGSLTAFGGCIHWIPASLRSPLETFGHRSWREPIERQPHRSRRAHKKSLPLAGPRRSYVETFLPIRASLLKEPPFLPLSLFSLTGRSH